MTRLRLGLGAALIVCAGSITVSLAFGRGERDLSPDTIAAVQQIGAFQRAPRKVDRLPAAMARQRIGGLRLMAGASRLVFVRRKAPQERSGTRSSGRVYVVPTEDQQSLCLIVDFDGGGSAMGCGSVAEFLGTRGFHVLIGTTGRPGSLTGVRIIAVTAAQVTKLHVRMPASPINAMPNADGGLWATLDASALAQGLPTALVSYDKDGNEVGLLELPRWG
jgi:hypothetical protein